MREITGHAVYSLQEVISMPNKPPLVEGLVYHRGKTVLVAKPKMGKTWLALKLGMSMATGQDLFGLTAKKTPVLYLEFDRRNLGSAIEEIARGEQIGGMEIMPLPPLALNQEKGYQELLGIVDQYNRDADGDGELVLIIDHKSVCFSGKENDDAPNRVWVQNLDRIERVHPVTYLVLCQAPKSWRGDIVDLPIGSRILTAWADTIVSLRPSGGGFRKLEVVSNYREVEPITYDRRFIIAPEQAVEETKFTKAVELIKERWASFVYPNTSERVKEVAGEIGCSLQRAWDAYREVKRLKAVEEQAQLLATIEASDSENEEEAPANG